MSNKLSKQDIDKLLDSIDIWESHSQLVLQSHDSMRAMYTEPEQLKEFDLMTKGKRKELLEDMRVKKDQAIILKYKLVKIKQGIQASLALDKFGESDDKEQK